MTEIFLVSGSFWTLHRKGNSYARDIQLGLPINNTELTWSDLCRSSLWRSCKDQWRRRTDKALLLDTGAWRGQTKTLLSPPSRPRNSAGTPYPAASRGAEGHVDHVKNERERGRLVNEKRWGPVWVHRSQGRHRESIWPCDQRASGCHMCRWGQRGPWRLECTVPAPLPHARACLRTGQTHSSEIWFPPIISAEKLCGGQNIPRGTGAPVFTFVDRLETTWGLWKKCCTDKHQDDIKTLYRKWLNMMIRSYQSKLFTVVRTEVPLKAESLSGNSPKHGPKMIHASIKSRKGL